MKTLNGTKRSPGRSLDGWSFVGIAAGLGMLLPAFLATELTFLAAPASALLVLSLMYETR